MTLIDLLNCYFGPMCDAVASSAADVLKLSAMRRSDLSNWRAAAICRAALGPRSVEAAQVGENRRREASGLPRIKYGLALHVGDVMYGNIGKR